MRSSVHFHSSSSPSFPPSCACSCICRRDLLLCISSFYSTSALPRPVPAHVKGSRNGLSSKRHDRKHFGCFFTDATALEVHQQTVLRRSLQIGFTLNPGAPLEDVDLHQHARSSACRQPPGNYFITQRAATSPLCCQGCLKDEINVLSVPAVTGNGNIRDAGRAELPAQLPWPPISGDQRSQR